MRRILLTALILLAPFGVRAQEVLQWEAPPAPPSALVAWVDGTAGRATTVEGRGLAFGSAFTISRRAERDFLRLRFSHFGEDRDRDRSPESDWAQTGSLLYGRVHRNGVLIASAAAGIAATRGFARGERLHESEDHVWNRPRRFRAAGLSGETFVGLTVQQCALGVTLAADANPVRQTMAAQVTFSLGVFP